MHAENFKKSLISSGVWSGKFQTPALFHVLLSITFFLISSNVLAQEQTHKNQPKSNTELSMEKQGMVLLSETAPDVLTSLMYTRADNFTGEILYTDLSRAYLHPRAAKALKRAQEILKSINPKLTLKVYDAARPMSVQQKMWDVVKGTGKEIYVSNPARGGGLHNYGLAVDITIADEKSDSITMGTRIDNMTPLAHIDQEDALVRQHKLTREAVSNRRLLRKVMTQAGFRTLRAEWWHFNFTSRANAKKYYKVIK